MLQKDKKPVCRPSRAARTAPMSARQRPASFASDDDVLEKALQMFRVRQTLAELGQGAAAETALLETLHAEAAAATAAWHASLWNAGPQVIIGQESRRLRLNKVEREALTALILSQMGLLPSRTRCCEGILEAMALPPRQTIAVLRALSAQGRLVRAGLVAFDDPDEEIAQRWPAVDPTLVEAILSRKRQAEAGWKVATEAELYGTLQVLTRVLMRKSEAIKYTRSGIDNTKDVFKWSRKVKALLEKLNQTLKLHPQWKLNFLRTGTLGRSQWIIFLALLGKELGHLDADDALFTGGGLARAAAGQIDDVPRTMHDLMADQELVREGLIAPCGGLSELASNDPAELENTEFELTPKAVSLLGLDKKLVKRRNGEFSVREPAVRLDQLVLSADVRRALDLALTHARCWRTLIDDWGLGEVFAYGRSPVMLFSGPPGVGKTATAEAMAHELGRPILVADYSRIQNCFVGQTEKNIARAFREAKNHDALLFWDEADAMFYDRDSARYNWEVREVNVLLQELEHFDGVCILATNRKLTLDKALQRRITIKVEFERPNAAQRRRIWEKLLPRRLPLDRDVDLHRLSEVDLVGGEIKNVVLNAARLALQRGDTGPVAMRDFQEAIGMEQAGQWGRPAQGQIGFSAGHRSFQGRV